MSDESIAASIDWQSTCLPGQDQATIVNQIRRALAFEAQAAQPAPEVCGARGFAGVPGCGCVRVEGHPGRHGYSDGSGEQDDAAQPLPSLPAGADVAAMAKELHTLLRNGKEFPYSDGEEKRHYELVVTRWLEKVPPTPDAAAVLAGLVEEMNAKHDEYDNGDHIKDYYVTYGITIARALVESALWSIRGPET